MFEGSLVESRGLVGTGTERWTALGSLTVQLAVAGLLIAIPLLRPQMLPTMTIAPPLAMPFLRKPPMPVVTRTATASPSAMNVPAAGPVAAAPGRTIWPHPGLSTDGPAPMLVTNLPMGAGWPGALPGVGSGSSTQPVVVVARPRETAPVTVSRGVSEGLLLTPIKPVYPPIAIVAHIQGTVVLEAVISKAGRIESLHAVSGPQMLQKAALDAVAPARYRPYLLSGEPTEVKTTITVVFTLGRG